MPKITVDGRKVIYPKDSLDIESWHFSRALKRFIRLYNANAPKALLSGAEFWTRAHFRICAKHKIYISPDDLLLYDVYARRKREWGSSILRRRSSDA